MNKMKIPLLPDFECLVPAKNGLKERRVGIIQRMSLVARLIALPFVLGMFAIDLQAQVTPETPAYDPNTDPRIDRRPHPNAPRSAAPETLLPFGGAANAPAAPPDNPVFLAFAAWIQTYRLASEAQKANLLNEGVALAKTRRAALQELIKSNPKRAIDWAISHQNRVILPPEVATQLEIRVSGCSQYSVFISMPGLSNSPAPNDPLSKNTPPAGLGVGRRRQLLMRYATINRKRYQAFVYGWRRGLLTKENIPLQGVAVDDLLAVAESPARILEEGEMVPANAVIGNPDRKCPLCGADYPAKKEPATDVDKQAVIAQLGNIYYYFDNQAHLRQVEGRLIRKLSVIGPQAGSTCDEPLDAVIQEIKEEIEKEGASKTGIGAGNNGAPAGDL
jgi:hypothetical protein